MDFVVGLPPTQKSYDSIWVVVDLLTKSARFIPIKSAYSSEDYARIFLDEIVCFHGIPLSTIPDWGAQFTSRFWRSFLKGLGTTVKLSTAFIPKQMVKWSVQYKTLKICLGRALLILKAVGIDIYLCWSLPITIVSIHPFTWLPMKPCMVGGVGLLLDGLKWVSPRFLVPSQFIILWKSFIS